MKLFAIICTRDKKTLTPVTARLIHTLSSYGVDVKILPSQKSIFEAYKKGIDSCDAQDTDIIIYCHDDIHILNSKTHFLKVLSKCADSSTGVIGPAGTTLLGEDAIWWAHDKWTEGYHRGHVNHQPKSEKFNQEVEKTHYGPYGQVVALDGLFLAARKEVWDNIGLDKPSYFEGNWDFYDIHYTTKSHLLGYKNYAVDIHLIHHSFGELVGRDSWHKNREAFIKNTTLPMEVKDG